MERNLTRDDIRHATDLRSYERGLAYFEQGRVIDLNSKALDSGYLLRGHIRGSGNNVYALTVWIPGYLDKQPIVGSCECPMKDNCKHMAAACLAFEARLRLPTAQGNTVHPDDYLKHWLERVAGSHTQRQPEEDERLIFLLHPDHGREFNLSVELRVSKPLKRGDGLSKGRAIQLYNLIQGYSRPAYLRPADHDILSMLNASTAISWKSTLALAGAPGSLALQRMVQSGRSFWRQNDGRPLTFAPPRPLDLRWRTLPENELQLAMGTLPTASIILLDPPLYLDPDQRQVGLLDTGGLDASQVGELNAAPVLPISLAESFSRTLVLEFPHLPVPPPVPVACTEVADVSPVPQLTLVLQALDVTGDTPRTHLLRLDFDYADHRVHGLPQSPVTVVQADGAIVRVHRHLDLETAALDKLRDLGFASVTPSSSGPQPHRLVPMGGNPIEQAGHWSAFLREGVESLKAAGWQVETDDSFELQFEEAHWDLELDEESEGGNDWFSLRFDLDLGGGRRVPLLPIIAPLLQLGLDAELPETISLPLDPEGRDPATAHRYVDLPGARLTPFIQTLRDLFGQVSNDDKGELRLSRFDAVALAELEAQGIAVRGAERLRELARRLKDFTGIEEVAAPAGLQVELRPYQRRGLDWLQFLRTWDLAGILADDMGLGKTVQTLAHLLVEKEAGRLDRPALVVAPTSLMGNWRREAARFAPDLRTLVLHGMDRHQHFDAIADHDLVLTTYPLLPRDRPRLKDQRFHSLILDEAQTIKNPKSQAATVVRALGADHRLCLTGTPMENHLGELWALFDFLMPGFLGDQAQFKRHWRTPIEQHRDGERQARLAQRVAPFMLRRRKGDVATELPPKTEIIKSVALGEAQGQLYEGIRLSMEKRVREAIASQGLARSHITILDALLKLRQTCCDPRLLKLPAAAKVTESAKLELLMDLLPEQLEEGRRILLFSQFTSMLGLIEPELGARGIPYAKLTGQTRKRDEAIETFRSGAANLFLISLKAGGVGLNLTEADTVILYDPWWNPAVEAQAADRAHRIGQDKPVFVYKLVTEQTVEERILAMQDKKRALAAGVYREAEDEQQTAFNADDLQSLFAPLGEG